MNDHDVVTLFGFFGLIGFNAWRVPKLIELFDERLKVVIFKTQVENLYVYSLYKGQGNDPVVETFKRTVDFLKVVENKHEVRVHLLLFQDVNTFTWFWDLSGKLVKTSKPRELLSSAETWEEFQQFVVEFEVRDRDERLRQLRKDGSGFDWVNENIFHQWQQEKDQ
jgi:hypothetical protein